MKLQDPFVQARIINEDLARADAAKKRDDERACDWGDPDDVLFYKSQRQLAEKKALLSKLVPDYKCPKCAGLVVMLRSWVISKDKSRALCRSCFDRIRCNAPVITPMELNVTVFRPLERWAFDADAFVTARRAVNVSQNEFARLVGWTRSYQRKLEGGTVVSCSRETRETILKVFEKLKITTRDGNP